MPEGISIAEIFFDESGHDGENLMAGSSPVFAHGSIHMEPEEAADLVAYLRKAVRAQSPELKAASVIRGNKDVLDELFGAQGKMIGHTQVYLVEKAKFAVGKIIDLLVEEEAYARGINLYANGGAKQMADDLYNLGGRALDAAGWDDLVAAFTSLMRTKQRKGGDKETVEKFFERVDYYRLKARRKKVEDILNLVWQTRQHAEDFQRNLAEGMSMRTLDPLQTSLFQLAHTWHEKLRQPIMILHDEQTALTDPMIELLLDVANKGIPPAYNLPKTQFPLVDVKHLDSRSDPRIQLADIAAGYCRHVAEESLRGTADEWRLEHIRRLVHHNSLWGDSRSWERIRPRDS